MISVRKATPDDAAVITAFQEKMAWETEELKLNKELVSMGVNAVFEKNERGQYWVAVNDNEIVASLLITYEWSDWRNCNIWWFQSVYVLPEFRRSGVFRTMYNHIRGEADIEKAGGLRLYVETNNLKAQQTYDAMGMQSHHYKMYEWLKD
jgi:GNAT superfamily N-acetyltransferase